MTGMCGPEIRVAKWTFTQFSIPLQVNLHPYAVLLISLFTIKNQFDMIISICTIDHIYEITEILDSYYMHIDLRLIIKKYMLV